MANEVIQMTPSLLIAMESEPQVVDLGRIASFMQKVGALKQLI
jgi:hypothetical protein